VTTLRVRFATTNAPESRKRGLLKDRNKRARRLVRLYQRHGIDAGALQEAGTYAEAAETRSIKALWARFNDVVRGRQVGNGVFVKRRRWKSRLLTDLVIKGFDDPRSGEPLAPLHIAVVQLTHRRSGFTLKFYAVHRPTRRADNSSLRTVIDEALHNYTRLDDKARIPWVIAGDMNVSPWGWGTNLGNHGVDHIRASEHFEPLGRAVIDRDDLSDHDFLIADAAVDLANHRRTR
jgi:hypothetical protein